MARPLRIEYPNAYYHVSNKADHDYKLFPGGQFYQVFLSGVFEAAARLNVEVHCWSLLKGEYHLLVKTPEGNLSRFMRQVDGLYTQNYQRLKRARGSVFRSRYKSVLFQSERYLLELSRFLHKLPPKYLSWPWSSLPAYLSGKSPGSVGAVSVQAALVRTEVLAQAGGAAARYLAYLSEGNNAELAHFYSKKNQLSILGDERFRAHAKAALTTADTRGASKGTLACKRPSLQKVVSLVAEHFGVTPKSILQAARGPGSKNIPRWVAMYLCQEAGAITLKVIAQHFGLQRYGTVSTTNGKLKQELQGSPKLQLTIQKLRKQLTDN